MSSVLIASPMWGPPASCAKQGFKKTNVQGSSHIGDLAAWVNRNAGLHSTLLHVADAFNSTSVRVTFNSSRYAESCKRPEE